MQDKNWTDVKKILEELASYLKVKGIRGVAVYYGVKAGMLYGWIKRGRISDTGIILGKSPQINQKWLRTGIGPMEIVGTQPYQGAAANNTAVPASISTANPDARERLIKQRAAALQGKQPPTENTGSEHEVNRPTLSPEDGAQIAYRVLSSNTRYARALWENLLSFQKAVEREEEMESMREMMVKMMEKIDRLESKLTDAGHDEKRDTAASA